MIKLSSKLNFGIGAILVLSIFIFSYVKFKSWEEQHYLSFVPHRLNVTKILYMKTESWGFGPGGNETGVIIYELPGSISSEMQKQGIDYFIKLPSDYGKWQSTPILLNDEWLGARSSSEEVSDISVPEIANYINKYGFGIPIDQTIEDEINEAVSKQGSFFAYGNAGILIVIPQIRRVVYAYRG